MSDTLEIRDLTVKYDDVLAVDGVSLEIAGGTLAALVGPSGCGKTSILRAIAGFETPVAGTIRVGGEDVVSLPPEKRRIGLLFQQGALFPHLSVLENVAFGLSQGNAERALETLRLVGLETLRDRRPHELSGGQQQRVALARALAPRPRLILLDEPFAALDASLRSRLREEVRDVLRKTGTTAVLVTHDQEEALSIADEVAVMRAGKILQRGTPREVYEQPLTEDVACLVGDANLLEARASGGRIVTPFGVLSADVPDGPCVVRIATESLVPAAGGMTGEIVATRFYGHDVVDEVKLPDGRSVRMRLPRSSGEIGARVSVAFRENEFLVFLGSGRSAVAVFQHRDTEDTEKTL